MRHRGLSIAFCVFIAARSAAQILPPPVLVPTHSIWIMGGYAWPLSHPGLTQFWGPGPSGSVEFTSNVSRGVSLGFALDGSAYWFRGQKFAATYPGLPFKNPPVAQISAGVVARVSLAPTKKLAPYVGASIGFSHMTGAEYIQEVNGIRVTYYNLPFQDRLAASLLCGIEMRLKRSFALDVEARSLFVNNDPDVGATLAARAGMRFLF